MEAEKNRKLHQQIRDSEELKDKLAHSERALIVANEEKTRFAKAEEKIRNDFYQLTLTYKNLQDEFHKKQAILRQQYEVPPELPLLKESNKLLALEIEKLRKKLHKWKTKDHVFETKALQKKLKKSNKKLLKLQEKIANQQDVDKYQELYNKIQSLGEEARVLIDEKNTTPAVKKPKKSGAKKKPKHDDLGFFEMQPESKKSKIFKEIIQDSPIDDTNKVFDLATEENPQKTLMDLVDINDKVFAVLLNAGIETFQDLTEAKIADLRLLLEISGMKPKKYQYGTWPIQARLAQKGEWDLINEYKKGNKE